MVNKKALKTIDKTKLEHRKTAAKKEKIAAPVKTAAVYIKSNQDTGWKRLITKHFESFLEFFYSDIHKDIDFGKGYEFLDKELQALIPESKTGERTADDAPEALVSLEPGMA